MERTLSEMGGASNDNTRPSADGLEEIIAEAVITLWHFHGPLHTAGILAGNLSSIMEHLPREMREHIIKTLREYSVVDI